MGEKGRPSKLTPKLQEEILKYVRAGNYIETAAACAGISKQAFYKWIKRGVREIQRVEENPHPRTRIQNTEVIYVNFVDALEKAQAQAEAADLKSIGNASKDGAWQASAWRLERKFPQRWGHKGKLEVTGKDGEAIKHEDVTKPSTAEEIREADKHIAQLNSEIAELEAAVAQEGDGEV